MTSCLLFCIAHVSQQYNETEKNEAINVVYENDKKTVDTSRILYIIVYNSIYNFLKTTRLCWCVDQLTTVFELLRMSKEVNFLQGVYCSKHRRLIFNASQLASSFACYQDTVLILPCFKLTMIMREIYKTLQEVCSGTHIKIAS